jgi:hypothetical protein
VDLRSGEANPATSGQLDSSLDELQEMLSIALDAGLLEKARELHARIKALR